MKRIFSLLIVLFLASVSFAQLHTDKIIGVWESEASDPKLKFEFFKSGSQYFGKLLFASSMFEEDGKTIKKDFKNPDKSLQSRSRYGIINVTNLTFEDGEYTGGELYNPETGSTYSLKVKLKSETEMEFRGYMGISLLGKTVKFKRVQ